MTCMDTITKKDLIDRIADASKVKRVVIKKIVQSFLDEIVTELSKGNRLEFRDFGVFESRQRAARTAQNPKTLERVIVPEKRTVKFKIGRLLKKQMGRQPARPVLGGSGSTPPGSAGGSGSTGKK